MNQRSRHVLVVDDEAMVREVVARYLERDGFEVTQAADGTAAISSLEACRPDLVVLDVMLPGADGLTVLNHIREQGSLPVILLTARTDEPDRVAGLEAGADDYVVKPFKPKELVARVRARLRGSEQPRPTTLTAGDLVIDVPGHVVRRGEEIIPLTPLEFDLLVCLARRPWQVFTREELLEAVWGYRHSADTRLVNVHVQRLRAKIEADPERPEIVQTVRGVGYKVGSA